METKFSDIHIRCLNLIIITEIDFYAVLRIGIRLQDFANSVGSGSFLEMENVPDPDPQHCLVEFGSELAKFWMRA